MDCGYTTSDWTSSGSSFSSPPPTTRSLPQKTRGKMTRRTRASSSKEASSSLANEISADGFAALSSIPPKCLPRIPPSQLNPNSYRLVVGFLLCCQLYHIEPSVETFLGVFAPRLTLRECFFHFSPRPSLLFIHDKPSSYGAWKNHFFFVCKAESEVPLTWRSSLNDLPSINFELVRERVKAAGLLDHGFKAKALMEEDLLTLAGLHPVPDYPSRERSVIIPFFNS
ncbi:hypothetical protein Salat_1114300 [Sesamum alatum]|uniref:Uncharacterized protein n=1 Tax=Sesamum alatum TaxID=300844 RepID=A0AAE2CT39_9LAMI|nr:hypothetical protein Salat_1114300 [Sesamum alatum]